MPIPSPTPTETRAEFLQRCLSDSVMKSEYPNIQQRTAVCAVQYRKK